MKRDAWPKPRRAVPGWLHEIEHDGFRILARRDLKRVRLVSRNGHDFRKRFPQIVAAIAVLPANVDGMFTN